jgi:hypothetical protein
MMKVYQIIVDGHTGTAWYEIDPDKFKDEISCYYFTEKTEDIPPIKLNKIMNDIYKMKIGDHLHYFNNGLEFILTEMGKSEYESLKKFGEW